MVMDKEYNYAVLDLVSVPEPELLLEVVFIIFLDEGEQTLLLWAYL